MTPKITALVTFLSVAFCASASDDVTYRKNIQPLVKAWIGEEAWNLNRWKQRGDVPGITKDQLDKLKLKY